MDIYISHMENSLTQNKTSSHKTIVPPREQESCKVYTITIVKLCRTRILFLELEQAPQRVIHRGYTGHTIWGY